MSNLITRLSLALLCVTVIAEAGAVPRHRSTRLLAPLDRGVSNFDTLLIRTRWDSAGYIVRADFRGLDKNAGVAAVTDSAAGVYLIRYVTGSMAGLADTAGIDIPIQASSRFDTSSTFTFSGLSVCRNWSTPKPEHRASMIQDNRSLFYVGDSLVVITTWRSLGVRGLQLSADYVSISPGFKEKDVQVRSQGPSGVDAETFRLAYKIPGAKDVTGAANDIPLTIIARDSLCTAVFSQDLTIDLRTTGPPNPVSQRVVFPVDRGVHEGDILQVESRWDSAGYFVRANFEELDRGAGGLPAVTDEGAGVYTIRYVVGPLEGLPDSAVVIPITAVNDLGDSFTDRTLRVCRNLGTPPPYHVSSRIRDNRRRFHLGDSLIVYTSWRSPAGLALEPEADYATIIPTFVAADAVTREVAPDSFEISYEFPTDKNLFVADGDSLPLPLVCRDLLCNTVHDTTLFVEIDNTGPSSPPVLDPLPAEWNLPTIELTGRAVDAYLAVVLRNRQHRYSTLVDSATGHFSIELPLDPGPNEVSGWSEDDLGNKSFSSLTQTVNFVTGESFTYPTPFRPMDSFVLSDQRGIREALIQIYNLEGDRIIELSREGSSLEAQLVWDGRDRDGDLAQPGYYLLRVRRVTNDGRTEEKVLPLLFRNDE